MNTSTKIFIGLGVTTVVVYWALTTKNEVVESFVFPLKVKLGLASLSDTDFTAAKDESIWGRHGSKLPSVFKQTIYRVPNEVEMKEINSFNLKANDIVQGVSYTIIGRGVNSPDKKAQIKETITKLTEMFPDNNEYKKALKTIA